MAKAPSPNGRNGGRDSGGRFAKGNRGGPGNPYAKRVALVKSLILEAVTDEDLRAIVAVLVERAKGGDIVAVRTLLDRVVGRPMNSTDLEHIKLDEQRMKLRERELDIAEERMLNAEFR